jgi:hypothetical protein
VDRMRTPSSTSLRSFARGLPADGCRAAVPAAEEVAAAVAAPGVLCGPHATAEAAVVGTMVRSLKR